MTILLGVHRQVPGRGFQRLLSSRTGPREKGQRQHEAVLRADVG